MKESGSASSRDIVRSFKKGPDEENDERSDRNVNNDEDAIKLTSLPFLLHNVVSYDSRLIYLLRCVDTNARAVMEDRQVWNTIDLGEIRNPWIPLSEFGMFIINLTLNDCYFDDVDFEDYCPNMRSLSLVDTTVKDDLVLPKTLEYLDLSLAAIKEIDLAPFPVLHTLIAKCTYNILLSEKNMALVEVNAQGTDCLSLRDLATENLRILTIQGDEEESWHLLEECPNLTKFTVMCAQKIPSMYFHLIGNLSLTHLRLSQANHLSGLHWLDMVYKLKGPFESLDFRECDGFDSRALGHLGRVIIPGSTLLYLNLSWCYMLTNEGIRPVLEAAPTLEILKLKGNRNFTQEGLSPIFTIPFKRLQELNVTASDNVPDCYLEFLHLLSHQKLNTDDYSDLSEEFIRRIEHTRTVLKEAKAPRLRIKNYYGVDIETFKPLRETNEILKEAEVNLNYLLWMDTE